MACKHSFGHAAMITTVPACQNHLEGVVNRGVGASVGPGWDLRMYISNKFLGEVLAGPGPPTKNH